MLLSVRHSFSLACQGPSDVGHRYRRSRHAFPLSAHPYRLDKFDQSLRGDVVRANGGHVNFGQSGVASKFGPILLADREGGGLGAGEVPYV